MPSTPPILQLARTELCSLATLPGPSLFPGLWTMIPTSLSLVPTLQDSGPTCPCPLDIYTLRNPQTQAYPSQATVSVIFPPTYSPSSEDPTTYPVLGRNLKVISDILPPLSPRATHPAPKFSFRLLSPSRSSVPSHGADGHHPSLASRISGLVLLIAAS